MYKVQLFYSPLPRTTGMSRYQKKLSPTRLSRSSSNLYQLLPCTMLHSIIPAQFTCLTIFLHSMSSMVYLLVWSPPPHTPHIFTKYDVQNGAIIQAATKDHLSDMTLTNMGTFGKFWNNYQLVMPFSSSKCAPAKPSTRTLPLLWINC